MITPISQLIQKSILRTLTLASLSSLILATPMLAEKPAHHMATLMRHPLRPRWCSS